MSSGPIKVDAALPAFNNLQSIMIAASPRDSTLLSGTGLSMNTIIRPMGNVLGPVSTILVENGVRLSQPPSYNGSNPIGDLISNLSSLKNTLTTMINVSSIKQGTAIHPSFPSINTINNNIDSLLTTIRTDTSQRMTASAAAAAAISSVPIKADTALPAFNNLQSIMIAASTRDSTLLSGTGLSMSTIGRPMGNVLGPVSRILNENRVTLSQPPSYNGSDVIGDLNSNLSRLKNTLTTMINVSSIKQGTAIDPGFPSINTINNNIDSLLTTITTAASQRMTASAASLAELEKKKESAAAAAQADIDRKTASAAAAESRRMTASAAAAAAAQADIDRKTASAAAASQRITASAAAAESRRITASAATAAAAKAELERKTASAAVVAAEQQRISGTLSELSSSLRAAQSTLQGGGGASAASTNPIESAIKAYNTVTQKLPVSAVPSSVRTVVMNAVSQLRSLQSQQRFVASKLNTAVRAINAAAAKKGGSRKNNFTRARKGGSRRKRTRSRSQR